MSLLKKKDQIKRVLVVDDEPVVCNTLEKFLTKKGHKVSTVLTGEEALKKVKKEKPHVVLLDIRMPDIDGVELLKRIKKIDKKIGVIMITAVKEDDLANKCMNELGAFDYITKPLSLDYLDSVLLLKLFNFDNENR